MAVIDFYYNNLSPFCRSVLLLAKTLGIQFNLHYVDTFAKEQLKPEFIAINPEHTVPTMVDGDFVLWESRAILAYLAQKTNSSLYPKKPEVRAQIDKMLYFDHATFTKRFVDVVSGVFDGKRKVDAAQLKALHEGLEMFDQLLDGHLFAASNRITIADYSLIVMVDACIGIGINITQYNNINLWVERCRSQMAGFDEIEGGAVETFRKMTKTMFIIPP